MIMSIIFEVVKEERYVTFPRHWPLAKLELKLTCPDSKSSALFISPPSNKEIAIVLCLLYPKATKYIQDMFNSL